MRPIKKRISLAYAALLLIAICMSCGTKTVHQNQDNQTETGKYSLVKNGLYKDTLGNLWFQTIDTNIPDNPQEKYIDLVWSDNFEDDTKKLIEVIDPSSFKALGADYYRDKNFIYHFYPMADGGSLRIVDGAEKESFSVFEHSFFASDGVRIYYKGSEMSGVDLPTFEPIIIEAEGVKIGWYARDKFNFYNGVDMMTSEEIELLKSELDKK